MNLLLSEAGFELKKNLRDPAFAIPALLFPTGFFILFASIMPVARMPGGLGWLLANYAAFGAIGATLFGAAMSLSTDRDLGLLKLKRVAPVSLQWPLAGKLLASAVIALVGFALLIVIAAAMGARLSATQYGQLSLVVVAAALPFGALGLAIGAWFSSNAAPGIINAFYLAGSALGGLWFPLQAMSKTLVDVAPLWPMYHLGVLARSSSGIEAASPSHVLVLIAWCLLGLALAQAGLKRKPY
jgi:ABC-2 type transport system permease protein